MFQGQIILESGQQWLLIQLNSGLLWLEVLLIYKEGFLKGPQSVKSTYQLA